MRAEHEDERGVFFKDHGLQRIHEKPEMSFRFILQTFDFTAGGDTADTRQHAVDVEDVHVRMRIAVAVFIECGQIFLNPMPPGEFRLSRGFLPV